LFGSRAKGNFNKDSDIDLIIVSETFKDVPMIRRMSVVLKELKFPKHIDVLCYTPEEFERIQNTSAIVKDALLNSVAIV
jgi:predicted nucleotidyltransferase